MKAKKIITLVVTALAVLLVVSSGVMKLMGNAGIVTLMTKFGVVKFIVVLGLMEITFAALFAYPKTMKIGFIMLSCYFSGALATELSHGMPFNALMPIVFVWIAAFLRDRTIFLPASQQEIN